MKDQTSVLQTVSLIVVSALLILTAYGDAAVMFWVSAVAMILLFIWFLADRKVWLAVISSLVFSITVVATTTPLF